MDHSSPMPSRSGLTGTTLFEGALTRKAQPIVRLRQDGLLSDTRFEITQHVGQRGSEIFEDYDCTNDISRLDRINLCIVLRWMEQDEIIRPSINIAPFTLLKHNDAILKRLSDASPDILGRLTLEITEHTPPLSRLTCQQRLCAILGDLRSMGVRLSMDDYGAGESSMIRLLWGVWDEVKIDGGLGRYVGMNDVVDRHVSHICKTARSMGIESVVEHLETDRQIEIARDLGADYGQGYGLARPGVLRIHADIEASCFGMDAD